MSQNALIYFLKAPKEGDVKTRLAKSIGNQAATRCYTLLCERLLALEVDETVDRFIAYGDAQHAIPPFEGSFGLFFQEGEDLGARMQNAFRHCFAQGYERVVLVGADIPDIDAPLLNEAFDTLASHDAICSPTYDGGYYLIGFHATTFTPKAFKHIVYSQSDVFAKTLDALFPLVVAQGKTLHDLDTLDDLKALAFKASSSFHTYAQALLKTLPRISVVLPVYREDERLRKIIDQTRQRAQTASVEIIVVDTDERTTVDTVALENVRIGLSRQGRAAQMNEGLLMAQGEIVLFLHADTLLPDAWDRLVEETLHVVCAGAFSLAIDDAHPWFRFIENAANLRAKLTRVPYGDQALFFSTPFLRGQGGFADIALMEDVEIMRRLKRQHVPIVIRSETVLTSSRRWHQEGFVYTTLRNRVLSFLFWLGVSPKRFIKRYQAHRD